jgi:hypothetical protein
MSNWSLNSTLRYWTWLQLHTHHLDSTISFAKLNDPCQFQRLIQSALMSRWSPLGDEQEIWDHLVTFQTIRVLHYDQHVRLTRWRSLKLKGLIKSKIISPSSKSFITSINARVAEEMIQRMKKIELESTVILKILVNNWEKHTCTQHAIVAWAFGQPFLQVRRSRLCSPKRGNLWFKSINYLYEYIINK